MERRRGSRGTRTARRDLLVISLAVVVLVWASSATGAGARAFGWLQGRAGGLVDEGVLALAVVTVGLAVFAARLWRSNRRGVAARHEAETRFRSLVERMPAVIYTWDPRRPAGTAPTPYVSPQVEAILGFSAEEWTADPELWIRQIHPEDRDRVLRASARADRTGEPLAIEYRHERKDGSVIWVRDEALVIERDARGHPTLVQGIMYDVTESKRAEHELESAEARYRTLVERVPAVTYTWESRHRSGEAPAIYISPQVQALLGYAPEEFRDPELWSRLTHPDDHERVLGEWARCREHGTAFRSEYRMTARDGHVLWVHDEAVPVSRTEGGGALFQGVVFDITDRKSTEHRLEEAEEQFRTLVEQLPVVVYRDAIDDLSTALYISPQYERMFGFPPEARLRDPNFWIEHLHPDDRDRVVELSRWTNETGEPFSAEYRFLARDGRIVWVRDEAELLRDPGGQPMLWQGVLLDVTARKQAEEALSRRDAILEAIGFAAERLLKDHDWETALLEVLERVGVASEASRVYVFENLASDDGRLVMSLRGEWLAPGISSIDVPENRAFAYADGFIRWQAVLSAGMELHGLTREFPVSERDALQAEGVLSQIVVPVFVGEEWWGFLGLDDCRLERVWPIAETEALKTAADTLGAAIVRSRAEQEREAAQEAAREAEVRYRAIVEQIPAVTYIDPVDPEPVASLYISPQVESMLGFTATEWIDDPELWLRQMHPEDREAAMALSQHADDTGEPYRAEYRFLHRDGRELWVRDEAVLIRDEAEAPLFWQGVIYDITQLKLANEALADSERREREAADRLRTLDEMKNTFLAAVSHELRSPLTSILGLALTLEEQPMSDPDREELLGRLATNARKLDRLLKDLLDVDRLSRGIVTPKVRSTDLVAIVDRTLESLDVLAERPIARETESAVVPVDPPKVERIVENLVTNAVRHTSPETAVWIRVWPEEEGAVIAVEDDGPGVPDELKREIFEPFRQGPTASTHSPGTGIGLSLVTMFAELHGGRAWVEDRDGGGSSFRVFFPANPRSEPAVEDTGEESAPKPVEETVEPSRKRSRSRRRIKAAG